MTDTDRSDELREMYPEDIRREKAGQNGQAGEAIPLPPEPPEVDPAEFFGRDGLLVANLARAVMRSVTCGFNPLTGQFYTYERGAWRLGNTPIEAAVVRLLGNRYRTAHARNVIDVIRHSTQIRLVTCEPVPQYINATNGMLDWAAGELMPHSPDYLSTVQLGIDYRPDAECPKFDRFLEQVSPPDCIEFIWEVIGYTFYSGNPLHAAILLYGKGRNGKGTLIRVLKRILGESNISSVKLHELIDNRFRTATLYGKLANLAGDLDAKWLSNTAVFKAITGGDSLQAEAKFGAPFDFTPWALPFYSTNKAFGSADSSEGWVSRWTIVPFPNSFQDDPNRTLDTELQTDDELRGVLAKGVAALPNLMARGRFLTPESITSAKDEFIAASDQIRAWIDEHYERDLEHWQNRTALYKQYRYDMASDAGANTLSAREFYNRMEQIGYITKAIRQGDRGFKGIRRKGAQGAGLGAGQPGWSGSQTSWQN